MKFTIKLKFLIYILCMLNTWVRLCASEAFAPSKGNITPVKLYHLNYSSKNASNSAIGSVAKVSRVVPLKQLSRVRYNFRNDFESEPKNVGFVKPVPLKPIDSKNKRIIAKVGSRASSKNSTRSRIRIIPDGKTTPPAILPRDVSKIFSAVTPASSEIQAVSESSNNVKHTTDSSTNSWDYLSSATKDQELQQIILNLSDEIIQNAAKLTRLDPAESENYILNSAISQLAEKQSRMLESTRADNSSNKGVRFSAKMKPVLNVTPLKQITINNTDHKNISGHLTNSLKTIIPMTVIDSDMEDITAAHSLSQVREIIPTPSSTTPTLMQVLSVPEDVKVEQTTSAPPDPPTLIKGFVPSFHTPSNDAQGIGGNSVDVYFTTTTRKARGPPKDLEFQYQIPSITSTSTVEPEVDKGYQTILESTTEGPKVIWYNHQQTPEDTFYPNSDPYLIPPEELPIELISENSLSLKPLKDDLIIDLSAKNVHDASYGENGNGDSFASSSKYGNARGYKSKASLLSTEQGMRMTKSNIRLQPAATVIDHNGIREFYEDEFSKNGGGSGKRLRQEYIPQQKEKGHFGSSYDTDIKEHEIVPTRQQVPYIQDDTNTKSYPPFHEYQDHHYLDNYPPTANKDEISYSQPISDHQQQRPTSGDNYYKEEVNRPPYRGEPESANVDYNRRPAFEPEKYKESSPGGGGGYGYGYGSHNLGHHHGYGYGQYGDKGFFSKAKDYFKNSDFSTAEKWFDVTIGVLAFIAFGGYIIMLLYQVFTISSGTTLGAVFGKSFRGAGELFDMFMSKGPLGLAYVDELEMIVKMAMTNVKRTWLTNSLADVINPEKNVKKGEDESK